jgi:hypothetical protein
VFSLMKKCYQRAVLTVARLSYVRALTELSVKHSYH